MTTTALAADRLDGEEARLADSLVHWLETGVRPDDLFADDVFVDLSLPHRRVQGEGSAETFELRTSSHPYLGEVTVRGLDRTSRGFLLEFEERWQAEGQRWYCRELIHCQVSGDRIRALSVYCTGDWDEKRQALHAEQVHLSRP